MQKQITTKIRAKRLAKKCLMANTLPVSWTADFTFVDTKGNTFRGSGLWILDLFTGKASVTVFDVLIPVAAKKSRTNKRRTA